MTTNKELFYWTENPDWYDCDEDGENVTLSKNAPERAKKVLRCGKHEKIFIQMKIIYKN